MKLKRESHRQQKHHHHEELLPGHHQTWADRVPTAPKGSAKWEAHEHDRDAKKEQQP